MLSDVSVLEACQVGCLRVGQVGGASLQERQQNVLFKAFKPPMESQSLKVVAMP